MGPLACGFAGQALPFHSSSSAKGAAHYHCSPRLSLRRLRKGVFSKLLWGSEPSPHPRGQLRLAPGPAREYAWQCLVRGPACGFLHRMTPGHPKSGWMLIGRPLELCRREGWREGPERRAGRPSLGTRGQHSPCPLGYFSIKPRTLGFPGAG